jgi:hypothetical protein
MQAYNVEVFDRAFNCIFHDEIDSLDFEYKEDYISYSNNKIKVSAGDVYEGNLISIHRPDEEFFGIVKSIDKTDEALMEISYAPFYSLFDFDVLFDTNLQGGNQSLEMTLKAFIEAYFVNNSDQNQNYPLIGDIRILSNTPTWGFNIKSDAQGQHMAIIGLYSTLFVRAFNKYGITVRCIPDFTNEQVDIEIGFSQESVVTIETGLGNVLDCNIRLGKVNESVNKLIVYDQADYSQSRTYYLHSDGTYDTTDSDRVMPVLYDLKGVDVQQDQTFIDVANSSASEAFGSIKYNNIISITTLMDDKRIMPARLKLGQKVRVIHEGTAYDSIYSGRSIKGTIQLTFGSVRIELTKILKGGYFNGR